MLESLSLQSLGKTKAGEQFDEALEAVKESLERDHDIQGARSITIKMTFKPNARGYIDSDISVVASTPHRTIQTLAAYEGGDLKIDTVSNDVTQPDLLEAIEGKAIPIRKEGGR